MRKRHEIKHVRALLSLLILIQHFEEPFIIAVKIDLEQTKNDWQKTCGPYHIRDIANHYGVYEHLYGYAYFVPRIPMKILYNIDGKDEVTPVYYGNIIKPTDAAKQPTVQFDATIELAGAELPAKKSLWTLIMTNPDGHLTENDKEYCHWFM